jgi:hypothetical protein
MPNVGLVRKWAAQPTGEPAGARWAAGPAAPLWAEASVGSRAKTGCMAVAKAGQCTGQKRMVGGDCSGAGDMEG